MNKWSVIGFEKNKRFFELASEGGLSSHAYIFSGQEMIGKRTLALELAVKFGSERDVLVIDSNSSDSGQSIAIEAIRKIKHFVSRGSYAGKYKFVIIDDAHLMTVESQNALLKILEEPSQSSILILVTACPEALLPTITSRCQEVRFFPHPRRQIDALLEDAKLSKTNKEFLAQFADGRVGLIKKIIDGDSFDEVEAAVQKIMRLARADINERFEAAQKLTDDKHKAELPKLVLYWTMYLRTRIGEPKAQKMLKGLLTLNEIVNKPQYNQRLALESFLVSL